MSMSWKAATTLGWPAGPAFGEWAEGGDAAAGAAHVGVGVEHFGGRRADAFFGDGSLEGVPGGVGEEGVAGIAGVNAVDGPDVLKGGLFGLDAIDGEGDGVAAGGVIGGGDGQVGVAAFHLRQVGRLDVPEEGEDDLDDGGAGGPR